MHCIFCNRQTFEIDREREYVTSPGIIHVEVRRFELLTPCMPWAF
jgi:hypothetical protein